MNEYLTEDQKILCDCDRPVLPPCVLTLLFTPEVNGVTFLLLLRSWLEIYTPATLWKFQSTLPLYAKA